VLERLSDYTESRQVMGQQVSNALVYPIVLMVLSFAIVSFLLAYVVPQVVAVFESGTRNCPCHAHPDRHERSDPALLVLRPDRHRVWPRGAFCAG
jgi:hypothetical protein